MARDKTLHSGGLTPPAEGEKGGVEAGQSGMSPEISGWGGRIVDEAVDSSGFSEKRLMDGRVAGEKDFPLGILEEKMVGQ
jgi:hypothetical protein